MSRPGRLARETRLIVVEGGTEEKYLRAVTDWTGAVPKFINANGHGGVGRVLGQTDLDHFMRVWVVVDAEGHPHQECRKLAETLTSLGEARKRLKVVLTSPKFEYWLLAHFATPPTARRRIEQMLKEDHG